MAVRFLWPGQCCSEFSSDHDLPGRQIAANDAKPRLSAWTISPKLRPPAQGYAEDDPEARFSHKRSTAWTGYKVHLTETCAPDLPRLITNVETTVATTQDDKLTTPIHQALQNKGCLPDIHIVDCGYMSAEELVGQLACSGAKDRSKIDLKSRWQMRNEHGALTQRPVASTHG